jgi:hypothetical protein
VERCGYVQYLADAYLSLPSKLYANVDDHLRHTLSMQQHEESQVESIDHILGIGKVLLSLNLLIV